MPPKTRAHIKFAVMVMVVGVAVCWVAGYAKKSEPEAIPEIHDTFTDTRDGKTYKTVVIGGKKWMAENLNYQTDSSWCYENSADSCNKYGRLYSWNAAKKACPIGYHLPTRQEWDILGYAVGGERTSGCCYGIVWPNAGKKLKTKHGWKDLPIQIPSITVNGTDDYGFSALPGGYCASCDSYDAFHGIGGHGYWWTATADRANNAYSILMGYYNHVNESYDNDKYFGFSVRCVADRRAAR